MDRVLQGSVSTIYVTFYNGETAVDSTTPVTIEILRGDGSVLVAAGTATTDEAATGKYGFTLTPSHTVQLEKLTAKWSGTISGSAVTVSTPVEVVGGFHFTLAELRAQKNLSDTTKFTSDELADARLWWETLAEEYCGISFVPRYKRVTLSGTGTSRLFLPDLHVRSVRTVRTYTDWSAETYTSLTTTEIADIIIDNGEAVRTDSGTFTSGTRNLVVEYEYGLDRAPEDVRQAGVEAARGHLLNEQAGSPMVPLSQSDAGVVRFAQPTDEFPTGIPRVDSVLRRHRDRSPVIA